MSERYSVVLDPCGIYFLWDEAMVEPVMAGDDIMAFVSFKEATREALRLNGPANDDLPAFEGERNASFVKGRIEAAYRLNGLSLVRRNGQARPETTASARRRLTAY